MEKRYFYYPDSMEYMLTINDLIDDFDDLKVDDFESWARGFNLYIEDISTGEDGLRELAPSVSFGESATLRKTIIALCLNPYTADIWLDDGKHSVVQVYLQDYNPLVCNFILDNFHVKSVTPTTYDDDVHFVITIF